MTQGTCRGEVIQLWTSQFSRLKYHVFTFLTFLHSLFTLQSSTRSENVLVSPFSAAFSLMVPIWVRSEWSGPSRHFWPDSPKLNVCIPVSPVSLFTFGDLILSTKSSSKVLSNEPCWMLDMFATHISPCLMPVEFFFKSSGSDKLLASDACDLSFPVLKFHMNSWPIFFARTITLVLYSIRSSFPQVDFHHFLFRCFQIYNICLSILWHQPKVT